MVELRQPSRPFSAWLQIASALFLALGLVAGGWFVGEGFYKGRTGDRYITVKGLAETFVEADLAIWPLRVTATGGDLEQVQSKIDSDVDGVRAFLLERGFDNEEIRPQRVEVIDRLTQPYQSEGGDQFRYIIAQNIILRSQKVGLVADLSQEIGALVKRGVVLVDSGGPSYLFTKLNDIKPDMLVAANMNARTAAEQFAQEIDGQIVGIRRAQQGIFQILPRDPSPSILETSQVEKKIRVVATIEYLLLNEQRL